MLGLASLLLVGGLFLIKNLIGLSQWVFLMDSPLKVIVLVGLSFRCNDPDLNKNATNYKDNHKHKDATKIILNFINVKY